MRDFQFSGSGGNILVPGDFRGQLPSRGNYVLTRCYGRDLDALRTIGFIDHIRFLRSHFPYNRVLVVIDTDQDKGKTQSAVEALTTSHPGIFIPVLVSGAGRPNWTQLLNAGLKFMHSEGVRDGQLLSLSTETLVENASMLQGLTDAPAPILTYRRTPPRIAPAEASGLWDENRQTMIGLVQYLLFQCDQYITGQIPLGDWYKGLMAICRNTAMVWSIRALLQMRGFDPRCNATGGQEDTEMLLRLLLWNPQVTLSDVPVLVYNDTRFNDMSPDAILGHRVKIDHELASIKGMLDRLRQESGNGSYEMDFVW